MISIVLNLFQHFLRLVRFLLYYKVLSILVLTILSSGMSYSFNDLSEFKDLIKPFQSITAFIKGKISFINFYKEYALVKIFDF